MRRSVWAGYAGAVETEDHWLAVQANVEIDLVERAGHKRRVDGNDRSKASHCHTCRRGNRVLFSDAHVVGAIGKPLPEGEQAGGVRHGCGDRHEVLMFLCELHQRLGEGLGIGTGFHAARIVHVLDRVVLRWSVTATLLREHVNHDWTRELLGVHQRFFELLDVMAVKGAEVMHAEVFEERWWLPHVANCRLGGLNTAIDMHAYPRNILRDLLHGGLTSHVHRIRADLDKRLGQQRHRRCVRASIVVQNDRYITLGMAKVVDPLVGHASRECAIADDRDDASPGTHRGCLGGGKPMGVTKYGRCVRVLDPVVRALLARGIATDALGLTEVLKGADPPGQHLVHIRLMPGVPQNDVLGRFKDPVQGNREFYCPEV